MVRRRVRRVKSEPQRAQAESSEFGAWGGGGRGFLLESSFPWEGYEVLPSLTHPVRSNCMESRDSAMRTVGPGKKTYSLQLSSSFLQETWVCHSMKYYAAIILIARHQRGTPSQTPVFFYIHIFLRKKVNCNAIEVFLKKLHRTKLFHTWVCWVCVESDTQKMITH